ncbi:MAG: hypothetical protein ACXVEF_30340 [Polyangiales bacterium]
MRATLFLVFSLAIGCGSSSEPQQKPLPGGNTTPATDDAGTDTGTTAVRALKQGHLLPGAPQNLILDATFRDQGWGKFLVLSGSTTITLASRLFGASPAGPSIAVGILKDPAATDDKSKSLNVLAAFLGGKGPFSVGVWVSRSNVAGDPKDFEADDTVFKTFVSKDGSSSAFALARTVSQTINGRTWWRYETKIDSDMAVGYFHLKVGTKGGAVWAQAPEVIALSAIPGDKTMSLSVAPKTYTLEADDLEAIAAYKRLPIQLSLPKLPPLRPGHPTPLANE